jgi:hypothetical protein
MWRNWYPHPLLMEKQNGKAIVEKLGSSSNLNTRLYDLAIPLLHVYPKLWKKN